MIRGAARSTARRARELQGWPVALCPRGTWLAAGRTAACVTAACVRGVRRGWPEGGDERILVFLLCSKHTEPSAKCRRQEGVQEIWKERGWREGFSLKRRDWVT